MKTYVIQESGDLLTPSNETIPKSSEFKSDFSGRVWQRARDEVKAGVAEITQHVNLDPGPPSVVTMRQARLALLDQGLLSNVDAAIASLAEPQKSQVQIEWEYSQTVERERPFVVLLGSALGLSDAELDDLFMLAVTL